MFLWNLNNLIHWSGKARRKSVNKNDIKPLVKTTYINQHIEYRVSKFICDVSSSVCWFQTWSNMNLRYTFSSGFSSIIKRLFTLPSNILHSAFCFYSFFWHVPNMFNRFMLYTKCAKLLLIYLDFQIYLFNIPDVATILIFYAI